jgi:hypothetical protein
MRTDAHIDRKLVKLPYRSCESQGKWKAQTGDMVIYHSSLSDADSCVEIARIAGRVHYAPALSGEETPCRDMLLVITFSRDMRFVMERWIKAKQVIRCYSIELKQRRLWEFMLSPDFVKRSPDELRQWAESGFATWDEFETYNNRVCSRY